jgi:class 3 adenylate cyclase
MMKQRWPRYLPAGPSSTSSSRNSEAGSRTPPATNVLAEFTSALDAVRCAIEIQASLQRANEDEPEGRRMRFRIGVNVGDVMVKDDDIFGDGVNVAARLEGLVKGGEICIFAGRARSPASSRRHGLRRFGRAAGQEHRAPDPSVSPPHR